MPASKRPEGVSVSVCAQRAEFSAQVEELDLNDQLQGIWFLSNVTGGPWNTGILPPTGSTTRSIPAPTGFKIAVNALRENDTALAELYVTDGLLEVDGQPYSTRPRPVVLEDGGALLLPDGGQVNDRSYTVETLWQVKVIRCE